ncbi:molybdenum cofactor guanylyltransferase [Sphingomonas metalli]|uniref:Molybdenum cofactor guanylyltransferase n=1 Tax=Sphingomonas metalli TaxID=1779358 RepID=A0A916T9J4_9SPHN|nr:molybdenum cofactor guanylyltransferase [Sphingomonas metalli]GGB35094.1 molybdenum cofactor guanylyltransferase [Sphingomonas metalli]
MTGILGAVLAGGRSSRFGSDKAAARLGGWTLAELSSDVIAPHVDEVVLIGREHGVPDLPRDGLGPLGGIAAALDYAATHGYRCVMTIGCDMPVVPPVVIEALLRRAPAYCLDAPILGVWPAALGAHLLSYLEVTAERSVMGWARSIGALPVAADGPVPNVNTPQDLARLADSLLVES